ncbi:unnamed protein product [Dicrocoelium dendriticum]|nr:unnamed protein product [Dicrocoelium dendriticum]
MKSFALQQILYRSFLYMYIFSYQCVIFLLLTLRSLWARFNCLLEPSSKLDFTPETLKTPKHLSLIIFEKALSIADLANIVLWAHQFNIRVVSVSDCDGNVPALKEHIDSQIRRHHSVLEVTTVSKSIRRYVFHTTDRHGKNTELLLNYCHINRGLWDFCDIARSLCSSSVPITSEQLAETVKDISRLPSVDLTVHFGTYASLLGIFPWHSRCSEFLTMTSHWHIQREDFLRLLSRFGAIKQRWGR